MDVLEKENEELSTQKKPSVLRVLLIDLLVNVDLDISSIFT